MTTNSRPPHGIFKVLLRTLDVPAARRFYAPVLGIDPERLDALPLHETAIARGARPHWIAFLEVGDVAAEAEAFVKRGATLMGPKWVNPEGLEAATMRDPGGALLMLAKPPPGYPTDSAVGVAAYVLHTPDVERAKKDYAELFGWRFGPAVEVAGGGAAHPFAWDDAGATAGFMADTAGRPDVHPHWLLQLRVAALAPALEAVRSGGGKVFAEAAMPDGDRTAICEDPQGAAFALRARIS